MTRKTRRSGGVWGASLGGALLLALSGQPAGAQSLEEALANAYVSNPTIEVATRAVAGDGRTGAPGAVRLPADSGSRRRCRILPFAPRAGDQAKLPLQYTQQRGLDLSVVQPLYSGGRTQAGTKRAEALVEAQRADLLSTKQTVLLDGATAYLDVVRDQAVVDLNVNNEQVLRRQLDASRDRFNVGEITRTDVSQAESRLARAISDRIEAEGQLSASRAVYARVIGSPPGRLTAPRLVFDLPSSRKKPWRWPRATIRASSRRNIRKRRLATPSMPSGARCCHPRTSAAHCRAPTSPIPRCRPSGRRVGHGVRDDPAVSGRLHRSRVREARQTAGQRRIQIEVAPSGGRNAIRAWEGLTTARATIRSRQSQVRSSEIALEGVRQEALVGSRTTLDTLDSEQELLDARVQLVQAQRNEMVAALRAVATGSFRPGSLACGFRSTTMKSITKAGARQVVGHRYQ